jgi:hypothetical protein
MTNGEVMRILKAALVALDSGNLEAVRQLISKVIDGMQAKRHK